MKVSRSVSVGIGHQLGTHDRTLITVLLLLLSSILLVILLKCAPQAFLSFGDFINLYKSHSLIFS